MIQRRLQLSVELGQKLLESGSNAVVLEAAHAIGTALASGNKLCAFGNGGLAMTAGHFVAELVGTLGADRMPFPAMSLSDNTAALTAIANDYGYDQIFARQLRAFCSAGDVALALSGSGTSLNVVSGATVARELHMTVIAMTGNPLSPLRDLAHITIVFPTNDATLMQEYCLHFCHSLALAAENALQSLS